MAFASRTLHKAERPYSTPEKECLGVICALEYFRPYVEGLHVTIYTDHNSLVVDESSQPFWTTGKMVLAPTGF